jgi:hypothetical protein
MHRFRPEISHPPDVSQPLSWRIFIVWSLRVYCFCGRLVGLVLPGALLYLDHSRHFISQLSKFFFRLLKLLASRIPEHEEVDENCEKRKVQDGVFPGRKSDRDYCGEHLDQVVILVISLFACHLLVTSGFCSFCVFETEGCRTEKQQSTALKVPPTSRGDRKLF